MRPCTRLGLNVTWRCQWRCAHCFYRFNPSLHTKWDAPLDCLRDELERGLPGGMDHAVLVGYGEPTAHQQIDKVIELCHELGYATSIITNGMARIETYERLLELGLDHLHISTHGVGDVLDAVTGMKGAAQKQMVLKAWLGGRGIPFRSNITLQQLNYQNLQDVVSMDLAFGVYHFVLLGFLPHYEWHEHVKEVAVHPARLRSHIEESARMLIEAQTLFTIRYHPLCHLDADLWKYVTNARHVYFDPWEWNYTLQAKDVEQLWIDAMKIGNDVACSEPCSHCLAFDHCGGWNKVYAAAFGGAGLRAIEEVPAEYADVWNLRGGLHDLNPANALTGTIQPRRVAAHH